MQQADRGRSNSRRLQQQQQQPRHPVFPQLPDAPARTGNGSSLGSSSSSGIVLRREPAQAPVRPPPPPRPQNPPPRPPSQEAEEDALDAVGGYVHTEPSKTPGFTDAVSKGSHGGGNYHSMRTPVEARKSPAVGGDGMRAVDEDGSSEASYDAGSSINDKIQAQNEGLGWFHAKIKVENSIQWANNYKIQSLMFLAMVAGVAVTIALSDNSAGASVGLLCGSAITIVSCSSVMYTFLTRPTWRKHPNPIIFFRSLCDMGLVIVLLVTELYKCGTGSCSTSLSGASCSATAGLTQLFLWSSESWFFVMAIDMLSSLQSPFTDFKSNMRRYHFFVWVTGLTTAILLVSIPDFAGESEFGYCWTDSKSKLSSSHSSGSDSGSGSDDGSTSSLWKLNFQSWLLFYIWLILYWVYAIVVIYWAYKRLHSGLSETLRMRLRVLHSVTIYVIAIIIYWGLTFMVYVPYLVETVKKDSVVQMMNFMITCKGYFDFIVWFQMNDVNDSLAKGNTGQNKGDVDVDVDLSPQVNIALRCEVLYYTTTGIIQAVRDTQHLPPGANQQELYLQPQGTDDNQADLGGDDYMIHRKPKAALNKGTLFIDYCPHTFQTIREHFGIDTNQYIQSLSSTTKERLSEGASGAFMFFSADQQLIVKSMSDEESAFLRSIAAEYASFLLTNPDSLLTRFYGCHAIRLYGNTFNFVVMANLFSTEKVIHRRYDIKGSWVNRSAKHPSKGKSVTCRHCNAKFVFGSTDAETCRARVGRHEPNVILKDNDLTAKVRLDPKVAEDLYDQLVKDANFLSRLGIMDYSLLLGVHNVEYMVNPDQDLDTSMSYSSSTIGQPNSGLSHRIGRGKKPRQGLPRLATGTRRANTVVGPSVYYFGLIDILQTWNMDKKLERFAKTRLLGKDRDGLSALPPTAYCDRFKRKMGEILSVAMRDEYSTEFDFRREQPADYSGGQQQRRFM